MQKSRFKSRVIMSCLIVIVLALIFKSAEYMWYYYKGPMYTIDHYVKALNTKNYDRIYPLLDKETLEKIKDKEAITQYYNRYYNRDNKLSHVSKVGWLNGKYILAYDMGDTIKREALSMIQTNKGWRICFPFKTSDLQIIGPNGSSIFLEDIKLNYEPGVGYKKDGILPGKYILKVALPDQAEKVYYKVIEVPKTTKVVLPYALGQLQVISAPYLEVHLDKLTQTSDQGIVQMPDILVGEHQLEVVHPEGYLNPITMPIHITEGNQTVEVNTYTLSKEGEAKWQQFLKSFYKIYEQAINQHASEGLEAYFLKTQQEKQIDQFIAWFVSEKDIADANVSYKVGDLTIDAEGRLQSCITETVALVNKEYDEIEQKKVNRHYKVIIKWQTTVDIKSTEWKIVDRTIKESMIAFQDTEGKWVQY